MKFENEFLSVDVARLIALKEDAKVLFRVIPFYRSPERIYKNDLFLGLHHCQCGARMRHNNRKVCLVKVLHYVNIIEVAYSFLGTSLRFLNNLGGFTTQFNQHFLVKKSPFYLSQVLPSRTNIYLNLKDVCTYGCWVDLKINACAIERTATEGGC